MPSFSTQQPELGARVNPGSRGLERLIIRKLTHQARLLVGCTLGLTDFDSVPLRL